MDTNEAIEVEAQPTKVATVATVTVVIVVTTSVATTTTFEDWA